MIRMVFPIINSIKKRFSDGSVIMFLFTVAGLYKLVPRHKKQVQKITESVCFKAIKSVTQKF